MWSVGHDLRAISRPELDVANLHGLEGLLQSASYDVLVNCTGLTNVDRCETAREEAQLVNACAPGVMAEAAAAKGARFIHFSTDYVFDGAKTTPYIEEDVARPRDRVSRRRQRPPGPHESFRRYVRQAG
jgi:dTDP-4-dehydrorhamnose reductase